jgi:hypothetical protein
MREWVIPCSLFVVMATFPPSVLGSAGDDQLEAGYALRADRSTGVVSSWDNRSAFFLGVTHAIAPGVEITPRVTFRTGAFSEYRGGSRFDLGSPETRYTPYQGTPLQAVEVTTGLQVVRGHSLRLRESLSVGILVASLGRVSRDTWNMNSPGAVSPEVAEGTGQVAIRPLLGLGTGVVFPCSASVGIGVAGEFWLSPAWDLSDHLFWPQLTMFIEVCHRQVRPDSGRT